MNKKPKMFYDYIKNKEKRDNKIGPFKIEGKYVIENKEICDTLLKQYNAQFSFNENGMDVKDEIFDNEQVDDISDIVISDEDIQNAIRKMDSNSTPGPDGIPAKFLIQTKEIISVPLGIIMRKSIDEGNIPDVLKLAYVTPIHKGGSKLKPENYRPVSLTSHIMKIF